MSICCFVVEPWAITGLPFQSTYHTEFSHAPTCHVVAALFQLDHSRAVEAFLPSLLLGRINELLRGWILGTIAGRMCFIVTNGADFGTATFAFANFPAMFDCDMAWLDPVATVAADAVDPVLGLILEKLPVPCLLELLAKELVNMFQVDVIVCATSRRHMCRIGDGHLEDTPQTRVAHSMLAWQACRFGDWNLIITTSQARDLLLWRGWCRLEEG